MGLRRRKQTAKTWEVSTVNPRKLNKICKALLKIQDSGRCLESVSRCNGSATVTRRRHAVTYKTAYDLVSEVANGDFELAAAEETLRDSQGASSPAGAVPSASSGLEPASCQRAPQTEVGNAQPPAAAATKADILETAVEQRLTMLGEWFGRSAAHEILSRSIAILERYRSQDLQVPEETTIWGLISLAIAMSGLEDIDEKRKVLLQRCPLGIEKTRSQECSLIMTLPFDQKSGL